MRKSLGVLIAGPLVLVWSGLAWPGEEADGRAIVAKAIKAMGGEKNLAKHKAATWTESGTYYGMGNGQEYSGKYAVQQPGQFKMEIEGVFTVVLDGDKGWIQFGGETKDMTKEQLALYQHNQKAGYIATLLPLKDKAFTLATLPDTKVEDRPAVGVKVTGKDYPEVKLYFDKTTHLLVRSEFKTKSAEQKFKDITAEMTYGKYKEIDGAQAPTKLVLKHDGKLFVEAEIKALKAEGKLDNKVFAKP